MMHYVSNRCFTRGNVLITEKQLCLVREGVATSISVKGLTGFSFIASETKTVQTIKRQFVIHLLFYHTS